MIGRHVSVNAELKNGSNRPWSQGIHIHMLNYFQSLFRSVKQFDHRRRWRSNLGRPWREDVTWCNYFVLGAKLTAEIKAIHYYFISLWQIFDANAAATLTRSSFKGLAKPVTTFLPLRTDCFCDHTGRPQLHIASEHHLHFVETLRMADPQEIAIKRRCDSECYDRASAVETAQKQLWRSDVSHLVWLQIG